VINLEGVQTRYENPGEVLDMVGQGQQGRGDLADSEAIPRALSRRT
jgi:hypothetical protein